jgi:hypothetical protein
MLDLLFLAVFLALAVGLLISHLRDEGLFLR